MKILINLFIIYFMISHFSHAAHHVKNKQDHKDNYIDNTMEEIDEIEHDEEELEKVKDNPVIYNARLENIKDMKEVLKRLEGDK